MKNFLKNSAPALLAIAAMLFVPAAAFAQDGGGTMTGYIAIGAGLLMGFAVIGGSLGQGKAISSGLEAVGRNPSAQGKILVLMIIGLALIESLVILAFVLSSSLIETVSKAVGA